jgi:hypothetical protein
MSRVAMIFSLAALSLFAYENAAHKRADTVLYPAFLSVLNRFAIEHGKLNEPGHFDRYSAKDAGNIAAIRRTFHELDSAWKEAGY